MPSHKKISPRVRRKVRLLKTAARGAAHFALLEKYRKRRRLFVAGETLGFALVLFISILLQTYLQIKPSTYALDPAVYGLIGESRDDTTQYLSENQQTQSFEFMVPKSEDIESKVHTGRIADAYSAHIPKNAASGISFTDSATNIDMTLSPHFKTYEAKKVDGDHIVYLASGGVKLVYTLKYNGLKEDIIVPDYRGDKLEYGFELSLPAGVEARLDEQGNIGIYSSDPTLFGNVSFGSDEDRARVEKAREKGEKTNLVATIPSPIVKDATGKEHNDKSLFKLGEKIQKVTTNSIDENLPAEVKEQLKNKSTRNTYELTISSYNLKELTYPISIDPTFQTSSASDFGGLNHEGNVEIDTVNNLIRRSSLTGGQTTIANTTFGVTGQARFCEASVAYNGFLYVSGGFDTGGNASQNTSYYVPIGAAGNITTSFLAGFTLPNINHCHQMIARDGYIYVLGGYRGAATGDVWRSKIRPDGSMSPWEVLSGIGTGHYSGDAEIVGDFVYIIGGGSNTIRYAKFQADGTLTAWASTTASYPGPGTITHGVQMASYNGVLYLTGGYNASGQGSFQNGVYYARPGSDGNVTAWTTSATMPQAKGGHVMEQWGGYLYVIAGCTGRGVLGDCDAETGAIFFAQINADGSLGSWRNNNVGTAAVIWSDSTIYNGIMYRVGGCNSANISFGQCDATGNQVMGISYFTPKPAGEVYNSSWPTTTGLLGARSLAATVAVNGYVYVLGGYNGTANQNTSYYAALNADGSFGAWGTTTVLPSARNGLTAVAYNGRIYIMGGNDGTRLATVHYALVNSNGTLGAWTAANSFTNGRSVHASALYDNYIYVIGGNNGSRLNSIEYAKINSDGTLAADADGAGACTTTWCATTAMSSARDALTSEAYNGKLYVIGGSDGAGFLNTTEYATINSDGNLSGSWTGVTGFTTGRYGHTSVIHNGYLYIIGGEASTGKLDTVQFAKINTDGTLGTWNSSQSFITARVFHGSIASNSYLYVIGGDTGTVQTGVQYQYILNGGQGNTGTWATTQSLPDARSHGSVAAANGYLYHVAGCSLQDCTSTSFTTTVYYTKILSDGTLTNPWSTGNALTTARGFHNVVVSGDYIYAIGGETNGSGALNIEYASLNATTGALGTWTTDSTDVGPSQRRGGAVVLHDGYIYSLGGQNTGGTIVSDVYFALPQTNGGLASNAGCGSKWCSTTSLPVALFNLDAVTANGYLYVTGGRTTTGDTAQNITYVGTFGNPGVSSWATATTRFSTPKSRHLSFAQNGYLYVLGGRIDGSHCNTIGEYAPILPGGQLGSWQRTTNMATTRSISTGAYSNGNIYIVGGQDCVGDIATVDRAVVQTIQRIGSFSERYDFGAGVKPTKLITRGTKQGSATVSINYANNIACTAGAYDQSQTITNTGYAGINAQTLTLGTSRTLAQCFFLRYTIDETQSAVFPDSGNQTTISDFDLYFTANPGQRLRGGRTFTNGADRGLDAQ